MRSEYKNFSFRSLLAISCEASVDCVSTEDEIAIIFLSAAGTPSANYFSCFPL